MLVIAARKFMLDGTWARTPYLGETCMRVHVFASGSCVSSLGSQSYTQLCSMKSDKTGFQINVDL